MLCDSLLESIQADLEGLRGLMGSPNWRIDTSSVQNVSTVFLPHHPVFPATPYAARDTSSVQNVGSVSVPLPRAPRDPSALLQELCTKRSGRK